MNFDSFSDFLAMGGHGLYVWLSYGASVIVVLINVFALRAARKRYMRLARATERRLGVTSAVDSDPESPQFELSNRN